MEASATQAAWAAANAAWIVGSVQAALTAVGSIAIFWALRHSAASAKAAALSAEQSAHAAHLQLRPYVYLDRTRYTDAKDGKPAMVKVEYNNVGATPAFDLTLSSSIILMPEPYNHIPKSLKKMVLGVLAPKEPGITGAWLDADDESLDLYRNGKISLYNYFELNYRDYAGREYRTVLVNSLLYPGDCADCVQSELGNTLT